jgi:hypothetical protein
MTPYALQDADHEWVEDAQSRDDAIADWHRMAFATEPPDRCSPRCAWRDQWGACEYRQTFPDCELVTFLVDNKMMEG